MSVQAGARAGGRRFGIGAVVVTGVGLLLFALGLLVDPRRAYFSYLAAYAFGLSLALGSLALVMIGHVTGARWFVVLRRLSENVAATLPLFAILFIPVLLGMGELYSWVPPLENVSARTAELIHKKSAYLNVPFFVVRAVIYFAVWIALALILRRWSLRQDEEGGEIHARSMRSLSAGGMIPFALTLSFAAFDWLMSLTPEFISTIFGVYYFAGGILAALALLGALTFSLQRRGDLEDLVAASHYHALGKLLLTFLIFWAYIAFAQALIVWIGDLPSEVPWYIDRATGSLAPLGIVLIIGHFFLPFFLLLSRSLKRRPGFILMVSAWILLMHFVDIYWLVLPVLHPGVLVPHWLDVAALALVAGAMASYGAWRTVRAPLTARGDPYYESSLEYSGG